MQSLGLLLLKSAVHFLAERFEGGCFVFLLLLGEINLGGDDEATQHQHQYNCYVNTGVGLTILQSTH